MEKVCNFLSSFKMTVISMIFLIISAVIMFLKIDFPFEFAWITVVISGIPIFYWGFRLLIKNKKMTASLLISIAMIAAIFTNEIFAAAEVAFIMALGGILEDLTINKAKKGITKLLNLAPKTARKLIINDTEVNEEIIPAKNVKKDDVIRILAGEDIPADGVIISGETSINQSIMTGESIPADKTTGDIVYSGTTNCFGVIDVKVQKSYEDSSIQKLIKLVKDAENKKAPTQRIVDKWAAILIPSAVLFAVIVYLITGEISRAVTILVVFCPCSLVLATPTSIMAAIGQATKNGIIIKTGEALETIGLCDVFAFDKTGTITNGKLTVSDIEAFDGSNPDEILYLAASSEKKSEHPIGKAIVQYALEKDFKLNELKDFKMFSGKGIYANLDNKRIIIGNEKFITDNDIEIPSEIKKAVNSKRLEGKVALLVVVDKVPKGMIALSDSIKDSSIKALMKLNEKADTLLLTGDNSLTADYFAKKSGVKTVYSGLLPKEKALKIEELQKENKKVCMTGDGVNDSIALKVANAGVSMGTFGSDIAIESSDIIITGDDLIKIVYLRNLSLECIKTIKTNITISMCINFVSLTLSALAILNPVSGAIVHNIASILVVSNAALLYDRKIKY
ncbi:TPA: cation-translocating P-type ATPase [Candidatus Galligastranaerophilus gallistercoris]|nr:cation-translocating P-type ATPase [Candidatus Galligastranaerophilus gallistercoris]